MFHKTKLYEQNKVIIYSGFLLDWAYFPNVWLFFPLFIDINMVACNVLL